MNKYKAIFCLVLVLGVLKEVNCLSKRCIKCRSRGELGSCRDPFPMNVTEDESQHGIQVVPCPSGWCGKIIEGTSGAFRLDDFGAATQRLCLQRPPSDFEERCAYTMWNHRKVYMCFCNGDLCNSANVLGVNVQLRTFIIPSLLFILVLNYRRWL